MCERLCIPSPSYLNTHYSFIDGMNAHAVLDELERVEAESQRRAQGKV